jgi:stage V sporulation protein G
LIKFKENKHLQRILLIFIVYDNKHKIRMLGDTAMNITDIRIRKLMNDGRLRAVVSITIDDMIAIHDIKVIEGPNRLFVAMPSRREENGTFRDVVHPISAVAREYLETAILDAYKEEVAAHEAMEQDVSESEVMQ